MSAPTNHFKVGLFFIIGCTIAAFAVALFSSTFSQKEQIRYHSYFNESVQGLELGAPVRFRGVTIGHVAAIEIAPDHRMIDVESALDTLEVLRLGLAEAKRRDGAERFAVPPDLRAQLNSQGVTGVKFIAIDFFDVRSNPPPQLPFAFPANHYIPAAPSMMKNLEDVISKAMERLPEMVDAVVVIMGRIDGIFATLEGQNVSGKALITLGHADAVMLTLKNTLERIDAQDLGGKSAASLGAMNMTMASMNRVLDELSGENGLLVSARHATDAFADVGREGRGTQKVLEVTLRDIGEAAEAIRTLANAIERDPDMLLKGKAKRIGLR